LRNLKKECLLKVEGVSKSFPGVQALSNVNFHLYSGEIVCLVGENGAGKSTLMKIICGVIPLDKGKIRYCGKEVKFRYPADATYSGIAFVHQELSLIPNLNVMTNIFIARLPARFGIIKIKELEKKTIELLELLELSISPYSLVKDLNIAQCQLIEIAKALSMQSNLIIMDEPNSTLSKKETEILFRIIEDLKRKGVTIIYISHKIDEVLKISDRISVLRDGKYIGTIEKKEVSGEKIIQMMIGRNPVYGIISGNYKKGEVLLEVRKLTGRGFKDISFILHSGEILGFAGIVGAGRSEVARAIFGVDPYVSGDILFENRTVKFKTPEEAIKNGFAMVPEDRENLSLFMELPVRLNMCLTKFSEVSKKGIINNLKMFQLLNELVEKFNIKINSYKDSISRISGGNQQKVVLARWVALKPKILILDEPTHGIDIGTKLEVYNLINKLAHQGIGIILISSELPEIIMMANRIIVMRDGYITGIFEEENIAEDAIIACATYDSAENLNSKIRKGSHIY